MADITLSSGKEITLDMTQVTIREYRLLFDKEQPQELEDQIISKVAGLSVEEFLDLPQPDWRRIVMAFFTKAREPLANPN